MTTAVKMSVLETVIIIRNNTRAGRIVGRDRDALCPYVPQIFGQLVAQYLKDAVYLTCGRQLLPPCCTHVHARTQTHAFANPMMSTTITHTLMHIVHFMNQPDRSLINSC